MNPGENVQTKRCFIAVNLPVELKGEIFGRLSKKIPVQDCKVVEQENLHITMLFLGNFTLEAVEEAREKMQALQEFKKFEVELNGVGHFKGRVFWIGAKKGAAELEAIAEKLQEIFGLQSERFSAHLTIARNKFLQRGETDELLKRLQAENFSASFSVQSIDFMESILSSKGPRYERLFSIGLR